MDKQKTDGYETSRAQIYGSEEVNEFIGSEKRSGRWEVCGEEQHRIVTYRGFRY